MYNTNRPLSPHLQIYKPQLTSILSILHRLTGVVLSAGYFLLVAWIYGLASNIAVYDRLASFFSHWFGFLIALGIIFSFYYHLANGVRHLIWDMGKNLEIKALYKSGYYVVFLSILMSVITIILLYLV